MIMIRTILVFTNHLTKKLLVGYQQYQKNEFSLRKGYQVKSPAKEQQLM